MTNKMKPKLKLLYALAAILVLCGCDYKSGARQVNESKPLGGLYYVDTISIHGKEHEIIRECTSYRGGIMHSPECWCEKEVRDER